MELNDYNIPTEKETCPLCKGDGYIPSEEDMLQCGFCSGNGMVSSEEILHYYTEQYHDDFPEDE